MPMSLSVFFLSFFVVDAGCMGRCFCACCSGSQSQQHQSGPTPDELQLSKPTKK
jgi:hypothetical protein